MTLQALVLRYAFFAVIATLANLATQRFVLALQIADSFRLALAIAAGTVVSLIIKYVLDKRWIFFDADTSARAHGRKFALYAAMGVATTGIFWGTETGFWLVWRTDTMREFGALLGLSVGYLVKYNLDRRLVFADARLVHGATP